MSQLQWSGRQSSLLLLLFFLSLQLIGWSTHISQSNLLLQTHQFRPHPESPSQTHSNLPIAGQSMAQSNLPINHHKSLAKTNWECSRSP